MCTQKAKLHFKLKPFYHQLFLSDGERKKPNIAFGAQQLNL